MSEKIHPYHETEKVRVLSLSAGDLYALSDLTHNEIVALTALLALADEYNVKIVNVIVTNYIKLKVSKNREGRKEILKVGGSKTSNILQLFTRKRTPVVSDDYEGGLEE